jgi:hypothetical protein
MQDLHEHMQHFALTEDMVGRVTDTQIQASTYTHV